MLKAFLTENMDSYRKPYREDSSHYARRTSFCATCNNTAFLIDSTGNRRFWCVPIKDVDLDALNQLDIIQLWAQIDSEARFNIQGFRLTKTEQTQLAVRNGEHETLLEAEMEILDIFSSAEQPESGYVEMKMTVTEFKEAHPALKNYSAQKIAATLDRIVKKGLSKYGKKVDLIDSREYRKDEQGNIKQDRLRILPRKKNK